MDYLSVTSIPDAQEIRTRVWTNRTRRMRVLDIGRLSLHVEDRPVLDALQAALDEIRADMDATAAAVIAEPVAS